MIILRKLSFCGTVGDVRLDWQGVHILGYKGTVRNFLPWSEVANSKKSHYFLHDPKTGYDVGHIPFRNMICIAKKNDWL